MFFILLIYYRVFQKACRTRHGLFEIPGKIAKIRISIYTLYRPHSLDDDEGERKADGDPKSDGDESAASALSIVTADRKSREDAAPNSTIERDMVDRVLSNRGAAIPVHHQAIIFARFVEE